jgi:hypothetical protein
VEKSAVVFVVVFNYSARKDLLLFVAFTIIFFLFSPEIACQAPNPPKNPPTYT